jgi:hypothetical protein
MRRLLLMLASVTAAGTLAGPASAVAPAYSDANGELVRVYLHFTSVVDTFSANGHTLVGLPYAGDYQLDFENGQLTRIAFSGEVERVVLPDGSVFFSAGRSFNTRRSSSPRTSASRATSTRSAPH